MKEIKVDIPLLNSLLTLATVIEARDAYTGGHTWRVSEYSRILAQKSGLSHDEVFVCSLGGLVHDLGKIGISDAILNKNDKLTDEEYKLMQRHPEVGQDIIGKHPLAPIVLDAVAGHHERYDGKGYPHGRAGDEISLLSRIIAIADAFDAMTSSRSYRQAMSDEAAFAIIRAESGKQFDAKLSEIFLEAGANGAFRNILQHSGEERELANCPMCGPIIVVPRSATSGDTVICPACKGVHHLHSAGGKFALEWTGRDELYIPKPDYEIIDDFIKKAPETIVFENIPPAAR